MRIAVVGPCHRGGSLPPYLDAFATALRRGGQHVHRLGSSGVPFDPDRRTFWPAERILDAADALLRKIDLGAYDLVSIHFGNLEIEQLLPAHWASRRRPPAVYHVHSLDWTLFTEHRPAPELRAAVEQGVASMHGFVYFGHYAQKNLGARLNAAAPHTVAWLPTTIPPNTKPAPTPALRAAIGGADEGPLGSLYGYADPWKDVTTLLGGLRRLRRPLGAVLAGPFWNDPELAGTDVQQAAERLAYDRTLSIVPEYLDAGARQALINASDLGLFIYEPQPTFQGSGAIADYLANAVPVIATDTANMAELVGDAGLVVRPGDPVAVADALHRLTTDPHARSRAQAAARGRASRFTAIHHAAACLRLYENVANARRTGATRWQVRQRCSSPVTAKPTATSTRSSVAPSAAAASPTKDVPRSDDSRSDSAEPNGAIQPRASTRAHSRGPARAASSSPTS